MRRIGGTWVVEWGLAGERAGCERVRFNEADPFQGAPPTAEGEEVHVTSITYQVAISTAGLFPPPYLVKLDCHGREHEILRGAAQIMPCVAAVVVEVYTVSLGERSLPFVPLAAEMLERYGLAPTDLCDPMVRPCDGRLSQIDVLFEKTSAPGMDVGGYC